MASESGSGLDVRSNLDVVRDAGLGSSTSLIIGRRSELDRACSPCYLVAGLYNEPDPTFLTVRLDGC